jgi:hypothetical protein
MWDTLKVDFGECFTTHKAKLQLNGIGLTFIEETAFFLSAVNKVVPHVDGEKTLTYLKRAPEDGRVVENEAEFVQLLQKHHPNVKVVQFDRYSNFNLPETVKKHAFPRLCSRLSKFRDLCCDSWYVELHTVVYSKIGAGRAGVLLIMTFKA